jgi:hypothetical protein
MDFSFGIITNGANDNFIKEIITSIEALNIPNYEIIIVGGENRYDSRNILHINFDESIKHRWITRKKNIICTHAKYENIVLIHDYIIFDQDWYNGFLKFGNDFDICISKNLNNNNQRFRDYVIIPWGGHNPFTSRALIPYDFPSSTKLSKISYISGCSYIIKKNIALKFPLNEELVWGEMEDLLLSKQLVNNNIIIKCNPFSTVKFLKNKVSEVWELEMTPDDIIRFNNLTDSEIEFINQSQISIIKHSLRNRSNINI